MLKKLFHCLMMAGVSGQAMSANSMVPLAPQDRELLVHAFSQGIHWTPQITKSIEKRPVVVGVTLFDGTENDRLNIPFGQRETVVGHIYDRLKENRSLTFLDYYPGVGTQANPLLAIFDAATGFTLPSGVARAVERTLRKVDAARAKQPDADVRILVSGFSRGGAAARHYINLLEKRWVSEKHAGPLPRFYALVFDTVATGQQGNLQLQVPVSADMFYHFVSMDERRTLFPPIIDISYDREPGRLVTVLIPGAHSDIGGSYASGIGSEYLVNIDALLSSMGLIPHQCFSAGVDTRAEGKNDSRWFLERWTGVGAPNTLDAPVLRKENLVASKPVPDVYWPQWMARMRALQYTNQMSIPRCVSRNEILMPQFEATRIGKDIKLVSLPPIDLPSARIVEENGKHFLTYTFDGTTLSRVEIDRSVLNRIPEGRNVTLSLAMVKSQEGGMRLWWFLDNIRIWEIDATFRENKVQHPASES